MAPAPSLPYTNTRLLTAEELDSEDSYYVPGTVVRLFHSPTSHPAVRQTLQGLAPRRVSLGALAVQSLVNKRGPDGVVGVIPGEERHSARLLALCESCHAAGEVLACALPSADMVLVPRLPETAARDGLYFLAYATNLRAVELCESLRQAKQVALVLDLDNTLVDAVSCSIAPNDWDLLAWRHVRVTNSYGRQIAAQYALLPGGDAWADEVWVMHWKVGRINCTFKVRVRRGWADLRHFLAANADKYCVFVCSKGKREYIQLLWLMLDPRGELIPQHDWDARLTSTYPDSLAQAANKTALTALGCYDITKPHVPTQVALPMMCLDDSTEAYEPEYDHSIMYVQEYRPSDLLEADNGNVLRQARRKLEAFWTATCTSEGTFAWQAAQSFAVALMKTMQRNPMGSPDDLSYLQVRCAKQGEALWHQFTVREVFGEAGVYITDNPAADPPSAARAYVTPETVLCAACQLPECKPGCPASGAAAEPAGPACALSVPAGAAADDAAMSEGRSSEDSVLLGLPSPACSVLAPHPGLHHEPPSCGGDASPTAQPAAKQQRLGGWGAAPTTPALPAAAAAPVPPPPDGTSALAAALRGISKGLVGEEDEEARVPPAPRPSGSALAAALAGISKGLLVDEEDEQPAAAARQPPLPPSPPPPRWERPPAAPRPSSSQRQQPAAPPGGGVGGSSEALSAALAAISKGLCEDGLL